MFGNNVHYAWFHELKAHIDVIAREEAGLMETDTMQMASALLSERKLRQRDGFRINPVGLHSQLKVRAHFQS
jgi:hypothetical protein